MHTWQRLKGFVLRAGKAIVRVVIVLNLVNTRRHRRQLRQREHRQSLLSAIGRTLTPVFAPMGIANENWPATVGIFTGVFAKEVVVGTLNALYANMAQARRRGQTAVDFGAMLRRSVTRWAQPRRAGRAAADPLGLDLGDLSDAAQSPRSSTSHVGTLAPMRRCSTASSRRSPTCCSCCCTCPASRRSARSTRNSGASGPSSRRPGTR